MISFTLQAKEAERRVRMQITMKQQIQSAVNIKLKISSVKTNCTALFVWTGNYMAGVDNGKGAGIAFSASTVSFIP